jgi:tetratricopeptide (TPR) repeat protein
MSDRRHASRLAKAGFDLWQEGRLEEAVERYRQALAVADPDHFATPEYHSQLAHVLAALGQSDEARAQYERYLDLLIKQQERPNDAELDVARYFLAVHLLKMRLPAEALATIDPSLQRPHHPDDLLGPWRRAVRARALWQLGRLDEARQTAREAMSVASSDETRQDIRDGLGDIPDNADPPPILGKAK